MSQPAFSVLLPTRNRLDLAKDAIETVRRQDFADWELIVADNCSDENVGAYVEGLEDARIIYTRSEQFISVTDNWNRALAASSGRHVVMLGDDDGLVPGYFTRMLQLLAQLDQPDFIYHGAYQFAFPGVLPAAPGGKFEDVTYLSSIFAPAKAARLMPVRAARAAGRAGLAMQLRFAFNMQYFLFSRAVLDRLAAFGPVFQGPFPDFYAANLAMLVADRIGLAPEPLVIIGISPKSYGYFHFNNREESGADFLNIGGHLTAIPAILRDRLLPGPNMNTLWLISVALIPGYLPGLGLRLGIHRYRLLQIIAALLGAFETSGKPVGIDAIWPLLRPGEKALARLLAGASGIMRTLGGVTAARRLLLAAGILCGQYQSPLNFLRLKFGPSRRPPPPELGRYRSMADVFDALQSGLEKR